MGRASAEGVRFPGPRSGPSPPASTRPFPRPPPWSRAQGQGPAPEGVHSCDEEAKGTLDWAGPLRASSPRLSPVHSPTEREPRRSPRDSKLSRRRLRGARAAAPKVLLRLGVAPHRRPPAVGRSSEREDVTVVGSTLWTGSSRE